MYFKIFAGMGKLVIKFEEQRRVTILKLVKWTAS